MNTAGDMEGDGGRDEIVAGEYVLGVLGTDARRAAERRIAAEPEFAALVGRWERDLAHFNETYDEVAPPPAVLSRIEGRLFPQAAAHGRQDDAAAGLWNSLVFWRGLTLASLLVVAGMAAVVSGLGRQSSQAPLVAELSAKGSPIDLVALYDAASGTVKLTPVAASAAQPKSLELWMINGQNPPVSLGVLPQNGRGEVVIPQPLRDRFGAGTVLAISLEPEGGSPTGAPTGPVVASGPARSL